MPYEPPERESLVTVSSWGWTKKGHVRPDNQDSFLNRPDSLIWAVADGVGQGLDGAWASRTAVEKLAGLGPSGAFETRAEEASAALEAANAALWARRGGLARCASTVAALLIRAGRAACLWSGDSRCYLLREGVLYQCTRDHSLRQEQLDRGLKSLAGAHVITRALGAKERLELERVDFDLAPGDRFLLCTDGLSGLLSAEAIAGVLRESTDVKSASNRFEELLQDLKQADNITQVTVFISGLCGRRPADGRSADGC